jgi:hypothetical protein
VFEWLFELSLYRELFVFEVSTMTDADIAMEPENHEDDMEEIDSEAEKVDWSESHSEIPPFLKVLSYESMAAVVQEIERYSVAVGFNVARNGHNMTADQVRRHIPHLISPTGAISTPVPMRGYFYCRDDKSCPFRVGYTFASGKYLIKVEDLAHCINHTHACSPKPVSGMVKTSRDLTVEERADILKLGVEVDTPTMYRILKHWYPSRVFCTKLIGRMRRRARILRFGNDKDCMRKLIEFGEEVKSNGGKFKIDMDESLRAKQIIIQTTTHAQFMAEYSDFVIQDGTHNTTMYPGLKLIPILVIDCLGRNQLAGFTLGPEKADNIQYSIQLAC